MSLQDFKGLDLFHQLKPEHVDAIGELTEEVSFKEGENVFRQGEKAEYLYFVIEGHVSLRTTRKEGVSVLINEAIEGTMFGYGAFIDVEKYILTATCAEDTRLYRIKVETLRALMDEDPILGRAVQALISRVYFKRYLETIRKLQAIVGAIPLA